jgi:hypothetical protein
VEIILMEIKKENFIITDNLSKLDFDFYVKSLKETYWASDRDIETIKKSLQYSTIISLFDGDAQVGFMRLVGDKATVVWICDWFVVPEHRASGIGKWFGETAMTHPDAQVPLQLIASKNKAYKKVGFQQHEALMLRRTKK